MSETHATRIVPNVAEHLTEEVKNCLARLDNGAVAFGQGFRGLRILESVLADLSGAVTRANAALDAADEMEIARRKELRVADMA